MDLQGRIVKRESGETMHEMAIAQSILTITINSAEEHSAQKVISITLHIGQMAGVEPEALHFCFSSLSEGTCAAGARLYIVSIPLRASCAECSYEFSIDRYRFYCPHCHSARLEILSGRELRVAQLEVE